MTVAGFLTVIVTRCRCPQAAGPRGCVHLGGEPSEYHLRGVCLPQCHNLMVPRWSAAAKLQLQQYQDLQQPLCQLPGGEQGTGQRQGGKGSLTIDGLLSAAKILLASRGHVLSGEPLAGEEFKLQLSPCVSWATPGPGKQSVFFQSPFSVLLSGLRLK